MNDMISRKAAIDALRMDISIIPYAKAKEYVGAAIEEIYNRLEALPSVQPEPCEDAVSRAEIVRWTHFWFQAVGIKSDRFIAGIKRLPSVQPEQQSFSCGQENDLISRKEAIDALGKEGLITAMVIIEEVPAVPQEQSIAQESFSQHHENDYSADDSKMVAQPEPCDDPRADVYYLAEKIGIHQLYALVVELRGEPAQPEITDEQAIEHLQASGWMQNHDKQMSEMGLRERLYNALFPSAQPDNDMIHLQKEQAYLQGWEEGREALRKEQRWIPVTLETLPNPNSVVVVCGKKGTWDYGTYRGWHGDIHSWWWKKNTIKHVYWWMYKDDAMSLPFREEGGDK